MAAPFVQVRSTLKTGHWDRQPASPLRAIAEVALIRSPCRQARGTLAGMVTRAALLAAILLHIARRPQPVDKGQARP